MGVGTSRKVGRVSEESVTVERSRSIATVWIDRPNVHNALNAELVRRLGDEITRLGAERSTRAVVLTGAGRKAFSAGADLDELARLDAETAHRVMQSAQAVFRGIERSRVPVLAAVNGLALGGGFELALSCAFSVVSSNASFGLPENGLGLIPGYGGTQRLARVVGPAMARYVMLTGQRIDAQRAFELGLAVVPPTEPDDLMPTALDIAGEVAARGPEASAKILEAVDRGMDVQLDSGLALETSLAALAIGGAESTEGIAAFKQRRKPAFSEHDGGGS